MAKAEQIDPEEALRRMEDEEWLYLDVRSVAEFEGGHPEGAYNIPFMHLSGGKMTPNADFLRVVQARFPKDAKLIVGCKAGGRSLKAAAQLLEAGFTEILDQHAGWSGSRDAFGGMKEPGWQPSGLPMAIEAEPGRDYASLEAKAK